MWGQSSQHWFICSNHPPTRSVSKSHGQIHYTLKRFPPFHKMLHRRQFVARMLVEFALSVLPKKMSARVIGGTILYHLYRSPITFLLLRALRESWFKAARTGPRQGRQGRAAKAGPPRHPAVGSIKIFECPKFSLDTPMMAIATTKLAKTVLFGREARSASSLEM